MQKKFLVKGASVLLIIALIVPSIGAISINTTSQKATTNTGMTTSMDKTWYVPDDFPTIQQAIDHYRVDHGDTIYVRSGTYNEHIHIHKIINLIGEDKETTIIDGIGDEDFPATVVIESALPYITISGFTIRTGEEDIAGILGGFCIDATISDNIITNFKGEGLNVGILFFQGSDNTITGNIFTDNLGGVVLLYFCTGNTIADNTFTNNDCGISIQDSSFGNTVTGNTISNSIEYGIVIDSNGNTIGGATEDLKNVIEDNPVGIWIYSGTYFRSTLKKNNIFIDNDIDIEGGVKGRQSSRLILLVKFLEKFPILGRLLSLPIFIRLLNLR